MNAKLFEICKKEDGSVFVDGIEIALYHAPYITPRGYEAIGITREQATDDFDPTIAPCYVLTWAAIDNNNENESERYDLDNPISIIKYL